MEYTKLALAYEQQADLAISRGLKADRDVLIERLEEVGYYRLSGYWHILKNPATGRFWEDATLDRAWDLYIFDRRLKLVTFDAIERVEVYLRTQLAYELAHASGPFGFLEGSNLPNLSDSDYAEFMRRCRKAFKRSREPFSLHFKRKYGDSHELPPYWMLVNVVDFGMVFTLYRGAPNSTRKAIAGKFGVTAKVFDSWLLALNTTRNICAHHGRLWNRVLGTRALVPRMKNDPRWHEPYPVQSDKPFMVLTVLSHMLKTAAPNSGWHGRLLELLATRSEADMARMGFSDGWESCPFWSEWVGERTENFKHYEGDGRIDYGW